MRHRCYENRRIEGFVLLYTLWLLLGGVVLFATVSGLTLGRSRSAAATSQWLRSTAAIESAAHEAMFRLVVGGSTALATTPGREVFMDGVRMQVDATNSDGLVDLNTADDDVLGRLFAAVLPGNTSGLLKAIRGIGRLRTYSQLTAVSGLEASQIACLLRYVTLSSGKSTPAVEVAPDHVRSALSLRRDQGAITAVAAPGSMAGSSARIDIEVLQTNGPRYRLLVDALVTGRLDRPVSVLEWQWLPATQLRISPPSGCVVEKLGS